MSNVISLSKHRKARARSEARAQADANAAKFGRSKVEKLRETEEAAKAERDLDGHEVE